jgi:hypothetical protein
MPLHPNHHVFCSFDGARIVDRHVPLYSPMIQHEQCCSSQRAVQRVLTRCRLSRLARLHISAAHSRACCQSYSEAFRLSWDGSPLMFDSASMVITLLDSRGRAACTHATLQVTLRTSCKLPIHDQQEQEGSYGRHWSWKSAPTCEEGIAYRLPQIFGHVIICGSCGLCGLTIACSGPTLRTSVTSVPVQP